VGGGSTEFILGHEDQPDFRRSFPLGTVRLLERAATQDPPRPQELAVCRSEVSTFLRRNVGPDLEPALYRETKFHGAGRELQVVATGGAASILGCLEAELDKFDRQRLEAVRLKRERLSWHVERLWRLPLAERKKLVGLPQNRADVILTGAAIYEAVLAQFGFEALRISTRGLRYGALLD